MRTGGVSEIHTAELREERRYDHQELQAKLLSQLLERTVEFGEDLYAEGEEVLLVTLKQQCQQVAVFD